MRAAAAHNSCCLALSTVAAAAAAGLCFFAFVAFLRGWLPLPSFPIRDPRGASIATCILGVAFCGALISAWRMALGAQPAAVHTRSLLSAPDEKGCRVPLFVLERSQAPTAEAARVTEAEARRRRIAADRAAAARSRIAAREAGNEQVGWTIR